MSAIPYSPAAADIVARGEALGAALDGLNEGRRLEETAAINKRLQEIADHIDAGGIDRAEAEVLLTESRSLADRRQFLRDVWNERRRASGGCRP